MIKEICKKAAEAKKSMSLLSGKMKEEALVCVADAIRGHEEYILSENVKDVENAKEKGRPEGIIDRLLLNKERLEDIADAILSIAKSNDVTYEIIDMKERPNGLKVGRMRVPMGVIGVIYEARPNVTPDVFSLCFKSGNVCILKGGSDAINSNKAFVEVIRAALETSGTDPDVIQLITDTSRDATVEFMHMNDYVDLLIPRGGAGLIKTVVEESKIPVIETGTGNCHVYVDRYADLDMAVNIVFNAKTTRIGVCNSCESLVVDSSVSERFLPELEKKLSEKNVEIRADERAIEYLKNAIPAVEEDFGTEYLDYIISVKTTDSFEEAVDHINKYSTGHSESIITNDYSRALRFLKEIDSAACYVNASTRFTDGGEFGYGAEIGISTQKLHARGPMGLEALTTTKFVIFGSGQVRE